MLIDLAKIGRDLIELATMLRRQNVYYAVKRLMSVAAIKAEQIKLYDESVERMAAALEPFFEKQIKSAASKLRGASGNNAEKLAKQVFKPSDWDKELINIVLPEVAISMGEGAKASLASVGVHLLEASKDTQIQNKTPYGTFSVREKASTATEWLASNATPEEMAKLGVPGLDGVEISTEYPDWLKEKITKELQQTFKQNYWVKINEVTPSDIQGILDRGLKDGLSIDKLATQIAAMGKDYSKTRGQLVARTESGHALNGGRSASIDGLKEELGEEAGKHIGKQWLSVLSNTTRDSHALLHGTDADENGEWLLGGVMIPWPSHSDLPAEERCNCNCMIITAIVGIPEGEIQSMIAEQEDVLTGKVEKPKPEPEPEPKPKPKPEPKPEPIDQVIREVESTIVGGDKETAVVFGTNGKELFRRTGNRDTVEFSFEETRKLKGSVVTHNHPPQKSVLGKKELVVDNATISGVDGYMLAIYGLAVIRAVTKDYTFSIKAKPGAELAEATKINASWRRREDILYKKEAVRLLSLVEKGEISFEELLERLFRYQTESQHKAWEDIADKIGIVYERKER